MKFILTNMSTKDIFYDNINDAETAYESLKTRNPEISLLVDFENARINTKDSTLKCLKLADQNVKEDKVYIISEGCRRLFRNNIKAIKTYVDFINKNYYPELEFGDKRIAAEFIDTGKLSKKEWDEA